MGQSKVEELLHQSQPNLLLDLQVKVTLLVEIIIHGRLFLVGFDYIEMVCFTMVATCDLALPSNCPVDLSF